MINVGLVGFGFAGRIFHAPVIRGVSGLRLAAVVQRHGSDAAEIYPEVRVVQSPNDLLAINDIELIVVATPNPSHFEIARQALQSGRHVVVDKPITTTCDEAIQLAQLAEEKGRLLSVYQNRRWDGDFITVKELIEGGTLGRLVFYESHFDRYRPQIKPEAWRERDEPGSGILFDLGVHLIDQAMNLFGRPQAVQADLRMERDGSKVDDAFDVVLHYDRMRALLRATMLAAAAGPRFAIHGTRGSFTSQRLDPQEDALRRGEYPHNHTWGAVAKQHWGHLLTLEGDRMTEHALPTQHGDYRGFYENVRDAILGRAPLAVTPAQAIDVIRVIELAGESSRTRQTIAWRAP